MASSDVKDRIQQMSLSQMEYQENETVVVPKMHNNSKQVEKKNYIIARLLNAIVDDIIMYLSDFKVSLDEYYTDDLFDILHDLFNDVTIDPSGIMQLLLKKLERRLSEYNLSMEKLLRRLCARSEHLSVGEQYYNLLPDYLEQKCPTMVGFNQWLGSIFDNDEVLKFTPLFNIYCDKFRNNDESHENDDNHEREVQIVNASDTFTEHNILILWLDDHIGQHDNCRALKMEFRAITNSFKAVESVESFRQCLPHVQNRKLFCIIQGKYAKEAVPYIDQIIPPEMEPVAYIFCLHIEYFVELVLEHECTCRGNAFNHEKDLLEKLANDLKRYVEKQSMERVKEKTLKYYQKLDSESGAVVNFIKMVDQFIEKKLPPRPSTSVSSNDHHKPAAMVME